MTVLVVGASGATGRLLVDQLLELDVSVRIIVRPRSVLTDHFVGRENVTIIRADLLDLGDDELSRHVAGCDAVASCLGHNLTLRGIFGPPRRLVTEATERLCRAVRAGRPEKAVRFILMNTAGNQNSDRHERVTAGERMVLWLIRLLVPPHRDNEEAAKYLRVRIGSADREIEWAVVRPDTLTDKGAVTDYSEHPSPTRSAIFNPGTTSRINVANFMARLITDDALWQTWRGEMPVLYDV